MFHIATGVSKELYPSIFRFELFQKQNIICMFLKTLVMRANRTAAYSLCPVGSI